MNFYNILQLIYVSNTMKYGVKRIECWMLSMRQINKISIIYKIFKFKASGRGW